jgi:hypothetical protein
VFNEVKKHCWFEQIEKSFDLGFYKKLIVIKQKRNVFFYFSISGVSETSMWKVTDKSPPTRSFIVESGFRSDTRWSMFRLKNIKLIQFNPIQTGLIQFNLLIIRGIAMKTSIPLIGFIGWREWVWQNEKKMFPIIWASNENWAKLSWEKVT